MSEEFDEHVNCKCGRPSRVAKRSASGQCAECMLVFVDDDIARDALCRDICAVIQDVTQEQSKQIVVGAFVNRHVERTIDPSQPIPPGASVTYYHAKAVKQPDSTPTVPSMPSAPVAKKGDCKTCDASSKFAQSDPSGLCYECWEKR